METQLQLINIINELVNFKVSDLIKSFSNSRVNAHGQTRGTSDRDSVTCQIRNLLAIVTKPLS
jgi:hypothetical protein